jgi:ABC-type lipoprotein release transport system permease subunit
MGAKITQVVEDHRPTDTRALLLRPITELHLYRLQGGGLITIVFTFGIIALIILLLACINFMNLTTAQASQRTKEVGMRKTLGARRFDLIRQFYIEAILMTILSLIGGLILAVFTLPLFNELAHKQYSVSTLVQGPVLVGILLLALLTGLIAGSYPALFLSSFKPMRILRSSNPGGNHRSVLRKSLVIVQFTLSIALIMTTIALDRQINFLRTAPLGYDQENIVTAWLHPRILKQLDTFKIRLKENPEILNLTTTHLPPYRWNTNAGYGDVHWEGQGDSRIKMVEMIVDHDYAETLGLTMKEGRFFSRDHPTDTEEAWVINEAAARAMKMEVAEGKYLTLWNDRKTIIGVVNDFHFETLRNPVIPMCMKLSPGQNIFGCIKLSGRNVNDTLKYVENIWQEMVPGYPFEYSFLDEQIHNLYVMEDRIEELFRTFTVLAIFLSSMGLFGLSSFLTITRTKEIGMRKILGSSVPRLMLLLTMDFLKWVLVANILAWPLAWWALDILLDDYAARITIGWPLYVSAGAVALLIAGLTISIQILKVSQVNPTESLRYE